LKGQEEHPYISDHKGGGGGLLRVQAEGKGGDGGDHKDSKKTSAHTKKNGEEERTGLVWAVQEKWEKRAKKKSGERMGGKGGGHSLEQNQ